MPLALPLSKEVSYPEFRFPDNESAVQKSAADKQR